MLLAEIFPEDKIYELFQVWHASKLASLGLCSLLRPLILVLRLNLATAIVKIFTERIELELSHQDLRLN